MSHPDFIYVLPEVAAALAEGRGVVALESTLIAHGMPYPQNLETAQSLEEILQQEGAVPATVAVIEGRIHVGLTPTQLAWFAQHKGVVKASRRDLAWVLSQRLTAATTVAATMMIAHMAGIRIFATGGIGGVHREGSRTLDISADLQELGRTPVTVVSAGAKAILDLGLTLEYLETLGVPVIGYQTDEFPAFYTRRSGHALPIRLDSPAAIAGLMQAQSLLDSPQGCLIANPVPADREMNPAVVEAAIEAAITEAHAAGIGGKELTPFLLQRISELTEGQSLFSNIALVENNARLAGKIAVARAALEQA